MGSSKWAKPNCSKLYLHSCVIALWDRSTSSHRKENSNKDAVVASLDRVDARYLCCMFFRFLNGLGLLGPCFCSIFRCRCRPVPYCRRRSVCLLRRKRCHFAHYCAHSGMHSPRNTLVYLPLVYLPLVFLPLAYLPLACLLFFAHVPMCRAMCQAMRQAMHVL